MWNKIHHKGFHWVDLTGRELTMYSRLAWTQKFTCLSIGAGIKGMPCYTWLKIWIRHTVMAWKPNVRHRPISQSPAQWPLICGACRRNLGRWDCALKVGIGLLSPSCLFFLLTTVRQELAPPCSPIGHRYKEPWTETYETKIDLSSFYSYLSPEYIMATES